MSIFDEILEQPFKLNDNGCKGHNPLPEAPLKEIIVKSKDMHKGKIMLKLKTPDIMPSFANYMYIDSAEFPLLVMDALVTAVIRLGVQLDKVEYELDQSKNRLSTLGVLLSALHDFSVKDTDEDEDTSD